MNRILTYLLLTICFLLISSCTIDLNDEKEKLIKEQSIEISSLSIKNDELNKKINDLDKMNNKLFDKNKEKCLSYINFIKKEIIDNNDIYSTKYELIEVFYSSNINECVFTTYIRDDTFNSFWMKAFIYWVNITNWKALFVHDFNKSEYKKDIFDDKIKELKE